MARSLRGGVWGSITEGLRSSVQPRDTIGDIKGEASDAAHAFSSWDACMETTYCKYVDPVLPLDSTRLLLLRRRLDTSLTQSVS